MSSSGSNPSSGSLKTWGPPRMVEVKRKAYTSLGLSIVGGKVDGRSPIGIFIKEVLPNSPAYRTGQLFTGDKIVKIGNQSTVSCDLNIAINAIENAGNTIQFVVQSLQTAKVGQIIGQINYLGDKSLFTSAELFYIALFDKNCSGQTQILVSF